MWYNIISKGEKIMKITKKQMEILEENFNVDETEYSNGKYLSLEQWTNGGALQNKINSLKTRGL